MLSANNILALHDQSNAHGHDPALTAPTPADAFAQLILAQHQANFDLWHREDAARDPLAPDALIVEAKHDIDRLNQLRNDLVEQLDTLLLSEAPSQNDTAPLHSETPGLIIDRLSILSLKIFHTAEEAHRPTASDAHHHSSEARLAVLHAQRNDLTACLDILWQDVLAGRRRFKLYRQLKMYNDPDLNPVLYASRLTQNEEP